MKEILYYVLTFYLGMMAGLAITWWLGYRHSYDGTIFISEEEGKTLFSLELEDDPEMLEDRKEVVFKVDRN